MSAYQRHEAKKLRLIAALKARSHGQTITLGKTTSNLFRPRVSTTRTRLPVSDFNEVLLIDTKKMEAEVEGMCTYETFVSETLKYHCLPPVVPELKTITVGGATTGIGIESSSWHYGFVHETVLAMDILLGDGRVVTATRSNEYQDLFRGFPNSYGTFGYVLKLTIALVPAKPYVKLEHTRLQNADLFFSTLSEFCQKKASHDFIDGTIFGPNEFVITRGTFCDDAPEPSDYTGRNIYYKTLRTKTTDYLTTHDYIWRWDTDWFWCSMHFGVQHPLIRSFIPKKYLRSTTYWKIRSWTQRHPRIARILARGQTTESVVQDVEIPIEHAAEFLEFFQKEIGIRPVWICPVQTYDPNVVYDLYPLRPQTLYINFGFWDVVPTTHADGYYNRLIEQKVAQLQGKKSLYSTSYYSEEDFWKLYNKPAYDALKQKYDPEHTFKNLYEKCVKRV